jgi:hypothetical protein
MRYPFDVANFFLDRKPVKVRQQMIQLVPALPIPSTGNRSAEAAQWQSQAAGDNRFEEISTWSERRHVHDR